MKAGSIADTSFSLALVERVEWLHLHQTLSGEAFDVTGRNRLSDEQIRRQILRYTGGREPHEIGAWAKAARDTLLRQLKIEAGLSIRQIERATGVSRGVVAKS